MNAIFATHLHEILGLPLQTSHLARKKMGVETGADGQPVWTYRLEDGFCEDSMALYTAEAQGVPPGILKRAKHLTMVFDKTYRQRLREGDVVTSGDGEEGSGDPSCSESAGAGACRFGLTRYEALFCVNWSIEHICQMLGQ